MSFSCFFSFFLSVFFGGQDDVYGLCFFSCFRIDKVSKYIEQREEIEDM